MYYRDHPVNELVAKAQWRITLVGMSGVGKTWLARQLPATSWFHFSADYRIGTRYLDEAILDNIKCQAMQVPFLAKLLRSDSIYINHNITFNNLEPLSSFLGKPGDPRLGGLPIAEFLRRQELHRQAEVQALHDVPYFIERSQKIYGYRNFINDAGGSICELAHPELYDMLARHTLPVYIQPSEELILELEARAKKYPKPIFYPEHFFREKMALFVKEQGLTDPDAMDPDRFSAWVFPHLLRHRQPLYEQIGNQYGITLDSDDLFNISCEQDFLAQICEALKRYQHAAA